MDVIRPAYLHVFVLKFFYFLKKSYSIWRGILGSRNIIYMYSWTPETLATWSGTQLGRFFSHNIQPAHWPWLLKSLPVTNTPELVSPICCNTKPHCLSSWSIKFEGALLILLGKKKQRCANPAHLQRSLSGMGLKPLWDRIMQLNE